MAERGETTEHQFVMPGMDDNNTAPTKKAGLLSRLGRKRVETVWSDETVARQPGIFDEAQSKNFSGATEVDPVVPGAQLSFTTQRGKLHIPPAEKQVEKIRREEEKTAKRLARETKRKQKEEEKKAKRRERKAGKLTPYQQAAQYDRTLRDNADRVGDHTLHTSTAGLQIKQVNRHFVRDSNVGEPGGLLVRHDQPKPASLPTLSRSAIGIRKGQQKKSDEWVQNQLAQEAASHAEQTPAIETEQPSQFDSTPAPGADPFRSTVPGRTEGFGRWGQMLQKLRDAGILKGGRR